MNNRGLIHANHQAILRQKMEVISHNLANINTHGFKGRSLTFKEHVQKASLEDVSFLEVSGFAKDFSQGALETTHNPLDVGLRGEGFFMVQTPDGPAYTRNGQFTRNLTGQITTADGKPVLDQGNSPITVPLLARRIEITSLGEVIADGNLVGRIGVFTFEDPQHLNALGSSLYTTTQTPRVTTDTKVIQGALESSNVSPILELTNLIETHRAYERVTNNLDSEDDRLQKTFDSIGRTNL